jgi:hypothetical protein
MYNPKELIYFDEFYNRIVAKNTLRAFHRIHKNNQGPTEIVREFIINSKFQIIEGLKKTKSTKDIDLLSDELYKKLKSSLEINVQDRVLKNYNAVRKLIDLILEHVALIAKELDGFRQEVIKHLRVPLDSFILNSDCLFTYAEREEFKLGKIGSGFLRIETKEQYYRVQNHLLQVTASCGISYPIYFDVLWRDRINYQSNLFE